MKKTPDNTFFLPPKDGEWIGYKNLRELPCYQQTREYLEQLWKIWNSFADKQFKVECQKSKETFNQRFWEMYLAGCIDHKAKILACQSHGPDICFSLNDEKIWIEAIAPNPGAPNNINSVPEQTYETLEYCEETGKPLPLKAKGSSLSQYENPIRLRYTNAIDSKNKSIEAYLSKNILRNTEKIIVAVNSANISRESSNSTMPIIVKTCFGFGDLQINLWLNKETNSIENAGSNYSRREVAVKQTNDIGIEPSDISVDSSIFLSSTYPSISGIVFSYANLFCMPFCGDLHFIHNPFASSPIEHKSMTFCAKEYWLEDIKYDETKNNILEAKLIVSTQD